jgi:hypothetical protein
VENSGHLQSLLSMEIVCASRVEEKEQNLYENMLSKPAHLLLCLTQMARAQSTSLHGREQDGGPEPIAEEYGG